MRLQQFIGEDKKRSKVHLIRYGGLSKVDYSNVKSKRGEEYFHTPPVNKGIYAFVWPYEEPFLWVWKIKQDPNASEEDQQRKYIEYRRQNRKDFYYEGWIWTHFVNIPQTMIRRRSGTWVEIHTSDFEKAFNLQKRGDIASLRADKYNNISFMTDPYKRGGAGGGITMSKDHLEVFIEKVN